MEPARLCRIKESQQLFSLPQMNLLPKVAQETSRRSAMRAWLGRHWNTHPQSGTRSRREASKKLKLSKEEPPALSSVIISECVWAVLCFEQGTQVLG